MSAEVLIAVQTGDAVRVWRRRPDGGLAQVAQFIATAEPEELALILGDLGDRFGWIDGREVPAPRARAAAPAPAEELPAPKKRRPARRTVPATGRRRGYRVDIEDIATLVRATPGILMTDVGTRLVSETDEPHRRRQVIDNRVRAHSERARKLGETPLVRVQIDSSNRARLYPTSEVEEEVA